MSILCSESGEPLFAHAQEQLVATKQEALFFPNITE